MSRRTRVVIDPLGYSGGGRVKSQTAAVDRAILSVFAYLAPGSLAPTFADPRQVAAAYRANMRARAALPLSAASKPEAMGGHGNDRDRGA